MKTVYELSESEIEQAIREWVERKNPAVEVFNTHVGRRVLNGREEAFANVSFVEREQPKAAKRRASTAKAAADVLGGSGGAMDRSSGLSEGLGDEEV
jgi:hypothetical protein